MITIKLESADNGVIKTVVDDNINGAGERFESRTVYDLVLNDKQHSQTVKFFYELCEDLGIDTGNKFSNNNLVLKTDWGKSYMPNENELQTRIQLLDSELRNAKIHLATLTKKI
tara:strand:- start:9756 stop:10097 length:342 start_codon:yes stop_codon:yes gene_type:complete